MWNSILKPALILFLVCAVVAGALGWINSMTYEPIQKNISLEEDAARREVLSEADSFDEVNVDADTSDMVCGVYKGLKGQDLVGYVISVKSKGYGGDIAMTVGVGKDGKILGVKIGEHNETPGLGSNAEKPEFINQFIGFVPQQALEVVKGSKNKDEDIQALTGATITSRAVTQGVQAAVSMAQKLLKEGI